MERSQSPYKLMSFFFIQRFLCLALLDPVNYGLLEETPPTLLQKALTHLSTMLQHLGLETEFDPRKEKILGDTFDKKFMDSKKKEINAFFSRVTAKTKQMGGYVYVEKLSVPLHVTATAAEWMNNYVLSHPFD